MERLITVTGHGVAERAPDEAVVSLGVDVVRPTAAEARDVAARAMDAVLDALRRLGVAPEDLRTDGLSLTPEIEYPPEGPPRRSGFRMLNRLAIRVRPPGEVATVVDAAVAAGATAIDGIELRLGDERQARHDALEAAVADARAAGEAIARASGVSLGAVASVRDQRPGELPGPRFAAMEALPATPVEGGRLRVEAWLEVAFEVEGPTAS